MTDVLQSGNGAEVVLLKICCKNGRVFQGSGLSMMSVTAGDICRFWFDEIEHSSWFRKDAGFDRQLQQRFGHVLESAKRDELDHWCDSATGYLGLIVVLDQFSRNIHRDTAEAFAADARALQLALEVIDKGLDTALTPEQRSFVYLPLRHAEDIAMQRLGLQKTRELNALGYGSDKYALNHLELIERFGRFPHRNKVLGRVNTPAEDAYLADGKAGF
jgi:uncharacterized protein (DUF924 family)